MKSTFAQRIRSIALFALAGGCGIGASPSAARAGYIGYDLYPLGRNVVVEGQPQSAGGGQVVGSDSSRARLWTSSGQQVDLGPSGMTGITSSSAIGAAGGQQVGYGYGDSAAQTRALVWSGSANSAVNLNPPGYNLSYAYGTSGAQQVGYASGANTGNNSHAMLWNGSAQSFTDLHPTHLTGMSSSVAIATNGARQAGEGFGNNHSHALLWSGTSDSAIDLSPTNLPSMTDSYAYGISPDGLQQVGIGNAPNGPLHALLWDGSATSAVDLHSDVFVSSEAYGTNGIQQVGTGYLGLSLDCHCTDRHAVVWSGSAASMVDLQADLPAQFTHSDAYSIDSAGNIYGLAWDPNSGLHAIEWVATPEPSAIAIAALAAMGLLRRQYGIRQTR